MLKKVLLTGFTLIFSFNWLELKVVSAPYLLSQGRIEDEAQLPLVECEHPPREPKGLLICDFFYGNKNHKYRIYCPSRTVRNITNRIWDKSRTDIAEDNFRFRGAFLMRAVVSESCGH